MIRNAALFLLGIVFASQAWSQELSVSATRTRVGVGEQFQVTYTLNTSGSGFRSPSFNDFDLYSGPNQSTSMSIVNGSMSQSVSFSFILAPKKEGTFTIGPASITANGKKLESKPLVITVVKGSTAPQQNNPNQQRGQQQQNAAAMDMGNNLFIRASVDKSKVFIGEQLVVTYKVYTRVSIVDNGLTHAPVFNGFYSEDVFSPNKQATLHPEVIDGIQYQVAEIKKTVLIPQRAGELEIDAMEMDVVVRMQRRSNNFFDQFFGGGYQDSKVSIRSKTLKIEVDPLPEAGKPPSFNGAVGEYSLEARVNKDKLKTNDGVNFSLTLSGKGNLKLVEPLKLTLPAEFESFDPKVNDKVAIGPNGFSGSKTYDYLLIPRQAGKLSIPAVEFSYFDPSTEKYVVLNSPQIPLVVEQGTGDKPATVYNSSVSKEDVKLLGTDIRYIKTKTELSSKDNYFYGSALFYFLLLCAPAGFVLFLVFYGKFKKENSDAALVKSRKATRIALKRLERANEHLQAGKYDPFYEETYKALYGYFGDKLNISGAELSKETIQAILERRGIKPAVIAALNEALTKSEFARYAPVKEVAGMKKDYETAVAVISEVEENLKAS